MHTDPTAVLDLVNNLLHAAPGAGPAIPPPGLARAHEVLR